MKAEAQVRKYASAIVLGDVYHAYAIRCLEHTCVSVSATHGN